MASVARTPRLKWHTVARTELQRPLAPKRRSERTRASSWPGSTPSRYTAELSHGNPCTRRRQKFVLRTSDVRRSEKLGLNWGCPARGGRVLFSAGVSETNESEERER